MEKKCKCGHQEQSHHYIDDTSCTICPCTKFEEDDSQETKPYESSLDTLMTVMVNDKDKTPDTHDKPFVLEEKRENIRQDILSKTLPDIHGFVNIIFSYVNKQDKEFIKILLRESEKSCGCCNEYPQITEFIKLYAGQGLVEGDEGR